MVVAVQRPSRCWWWWCWPAELLCPSSGAEERGEAPVTADADPATVTFDRATVELDALQRAAYAVAAMMTVDIRASADDYMCTLFPRRAGLDEGELKHRIRTEVIDQTLRLRIAKETEPIRNLIFALAFSQTGLAEGEKSEPMRLLRDATAAAVVGLATAAAAVPPLRPRLGLADEPGRGALCSCPRNSSWPCWTVPADDQELLAELAGQAPDPAAG